MVVTPDPGARFVPLGRRPSPSQCGQRPLCKLLPVAPCLPDSPKMLTVRRHRPGPGHGATVLDPRASTIRAWTRVSTRSTKGTKGERLGQVLPRWRSVPQTKGMRGWIGVQLPGLPVLDRRHEFWTGNGYRATLIGDATLDQVLEAFEAGPDARPRSGSPRLPRRSRFRVSRSGRLPQQPDRSRHR
jgi:hypothetical protein